MTLVALFALPAVDALACVNNADCIDDGSICTVEVCNPPSPGADAFGCTHPNPASPAPICPTAYSGLATVVGADVGNVIDLVLVEAGPLPIDGGAGEAYLVNANLTQPDIQLSTQALHALTIGQGNAVNTSASVDDFDAVIAGVAITADAVASQSATLCSNGVASRSGSSVITNLNIGGQSISPSGQPNQTISFQVGLLDVTVIVNEQTGSASGGTADITVNAVHIFVDQAGLPRADVVISASHSDIVCGIAEFCSANADCTDDGNVCTDEVCNVGAPGADAFGCTHPNNTAPCDDSTFCNGVDTCAAGSCNHAGDPCLGGGICGDSCNETADNCFDTAGTTCRADAGDCDVAETCSGSSASCPADGFNPSGTACSADGNACTVDACNGAGTCNHTANSGLCDDGLFCNGAETCSATLGCQAGSPPICGDAVSCTNDACNEASNSCDHVAENSLCADSNACTDDTCNPITGCQFSNNNAPCDDQNACTVNDHCVAGQCVPGVSSVCGNGVVDLACGEHCDTPLAEVCNNGTDDDGDGLIDCADIDCAALPVQGCNAQCQLTPPCVALLRDPAVIYMDDGAKSSSNGSSHDFAFHARIVPTTPLSPIVDGFSVVLSNAEGTIYRADVSPDDLEQRGTRRWSLKGAASEAAKRDGGISALFIRARSEGGQRGFGIRVKAYGDFSRATLATMTTQVYVGDDVAYVTAAWTRRADRWTLKENQY